MKRVLKLGILIVLICTLILTGCGNKQPSSTDDGEAKKVLTIAMGSDILTTDAQNHTNTSTECVLDNMTSRLFRRNQDNDIENDLAVSYEIVDDTTWRFVIKEGVTFHNGDTLTSEDVKFSLERASRDESLKEYVYFKGIKEVNVIDETTFEIVTFEPMPTMLNLLAKSGADILPKNYIEENGLDHFLANPVYSGPYEFVEWVRDDHITLKPYENYYEGKRDEWDEVVFRVIPEISTRVGELLTGGVDIAIDVPPNEWDRINNSEIAKVVEGDTTRIMLLVVRLTEGHVTADPKVREAIDLAIDDKKICDYLLGGSAVPVRTRVARGTVGVNMDLYDTYLYDPERAKELLAEAGYPDGIEITMHAPKGRYLMDGEVAQMVASMLEEVGIHVNLELMEWSNFNQVYKTKKHKEIVMIGLADNFFDASYPCIHYTNGRAKGETDYYNEEVEELYAKASVNLNLEERVKQFERIQEIAAEERPHICMYQMKAFYGVNNRIDFQPRIDEMTIIDEIKLKK